MLSGSLWVLHIVGALVIADSSDGGGRGKETGKWSAQDSGVTFEWPNKCSWGLPLGSCC